MPAGVAGVSRGLGFAAAVLGAGLLAATGRSGAPVPADEVEAATSAADTRV
jgi:hypothetical protein